MYVWDESSRSLPSLSAPLQNRWRKCRKGTAQPIRWIYTWVQPTIPWVVQHNPGQLPQATLPGTCRNVLYETTPEISWLQNLKCLAKEGNIRHMGHRMNIINICSPELYGDAQLPHARTHKQVHSYHRMAFLESLTINDFGHPLVHLQPPKLACKCKSTKILRV